jgi:DNA-binding LytR/AlgR family response regulator
MSYSVLIIEDEFIVAKDIENTLVELGYIVLGICNTVSNALLQIQKEKPNLILMDVFLKDGDNGIQGAKLIKEKFDIPVVFLTGNIDFNTLQEAKKAQPFGFIVKPFKTTDLYASIELSIYNHNKQLEQSQISNDSSKTSEFFIRINNKIIKIDIYDILFIEALKDYVIIYTSNETHRFISSMKEMELKLKGSIFVRVHRSFIINLSKIETIEQLNIRLQNFKKNIPIGRSYKEDFFKKINLL